MIASILSHSSPLDSLGLVTVCAAKQKKEGSHHQPANLPVAITHHNYQEVAANGG
jgi:hypothetical protein